MIYWDTSCVLKLFTAESDSGHWLSMAGQVNEELVSSAILEVEMAYALEQKEARGELREGGARHLHRLFRESCKSGQIILFPVGSDVLNEAQSLAKLCYGGQPPVAIRTLDGIHLATARILKCRAFATADLRMQAAARCLGMTLVS